MENKVAVESRKKKTERINTILEILSKEYPNVKIQLTYHTPHQLMVATILSAQCTDARVNQVTETLFKKYLIPEDYLKVPQEELEKDIFSTGYYKAKAKHIQAATKKIIEDFEGKVPDNMEELLTLPGVGRKTANVILGHSFGIPGIVVDTHVIRISNRLGLTKTKNAEIIERELMKIIPEVQWIIFTHYFINHGRKVCSSRKPKCGICQIFKYCKWDAKENYE